MTFSPATFAVGIVGTDGTTPAMVFTINGARRGQQVCFTATATKVGGGTCSFVSCLTIPDCCAVITPANDGRKFTASLSAVAVRPSGPGTAVSDEIDNLVLSNITQQTESGTVDITLIRNIGSLTPTTQTYSFDVVLGPMQTTVIPLTDDGCHPQGDTGEILVNVISHNQPGTDTSDATVVQASIARSEVSPLSALVVSLATGARVSPLVRVVPSGTGVLQIVLDGPTTGTVPVALDASDLAILLGADSDGTLRLNGAFTGGRCTLNVNYQVEPSNTPYSVRIRADRLNNGSFADVGILLLAYPPPACLAAVANNSLDTTRNPNGSVGAEDLDSFIAAFNAGNASVADVASDSLDTTDNPNGTVGAEDLDAFIASFITVCL